MYSKVYNCNIILLPVVHNRAGNITILENMVNIPFDVKRVYYLYDVPGGAERGGHAHRKLQQFIVALSGSFDVILDDGQVKRIITLNQPNQCLHVVQGIWREIINISSGSICLVLASELYDENDYIRDYEVFKELKRNYDEL